MQTFAYTAIDRGGKKTAGTLTADSKSAAIAQVVRQGMHPVSVAEAKSAAAKKAASAVKAKDDAGVPGRVPAKAVENFTREMANLLAGGVPLARAMNLLRRESSNPAAKHLWGAIHDDVIGGMALADAMARHPKSFSGVYVAMVRAGEAGGFLDVVLGQIADFRMREADLMGKVKAALIYPVLLAILATGVVIFLLTFFIPKFSGMFASLGSELPLITQIIIAISNIVRGYGLFLAPVVVAAVIGIRVAARTDAGRRRTEKVILAVPLLGKISSRFAMVRFTRMLGTLAGAGVPLVSSLRVAREAIGNQTLADTVSHAIEEVQRGQTLSKSLWSSPNLFPAAVVETIAVAEETARLDKELIRVASTYESDLERQLRMLVAIAEPLLLFLMAAIIGSIVIGMLLPVFKLQELVK
jgi:type II secretory pathway component PulF